MRFINFDLFHNKAFGRQLGALKPRQHPLILLCISNSVLLNSSKCESEPVPDENYPTSRVRSRRKSSASRWIVFRLAWT